MCINSQLIQSDQGPVDPGHHPDRPLGRATASVHPRPGRLPTSQAREGCAPLQTIVKCPGGQVVGSTICAWCTPANEARSPPALGSVPGGVGAGGTLGTGVRPARVCHPPSSVLQKLVARSPPSIPSEQHLRRQVPHPTGVLVMGLHHGPRHVDPDVLGGLPLVVCWLYIRIILALCTTCTGSVCGNHV